MTTETPAAPLTSPAFRRIVWPLAVAQTLVWAAMYYSFPALLLTWEEALGWSKAALSGAFTASLVVSAVLAPAVGRVIDQGHGPRLFTGSALLGAVCLAGLAGVTAVWQFYVLYLLLGAAMAGCLYEACFAILTRTMGANRKQAITLVTLVAGFAGTLSFPGNHALVTLVGWRGAMVALALVVALGGAPLIWLGSRAAEAGYIPRPAPADGSGERANGFIYSATFWLLAVGFATIALNHGVLLTHLLPLLDERGVPGGLAVLAASMIGPMQVAGRLGMVFAERRVSSLTIFVACFMAMGIAALALWGAGARPALVAAFVLFQGAGYGVTSILRPVITADLLGDKNFGLIAGFLAVPFLSAFAAAPTLAALIWGLGGYDLVIVFAAGAAGLGLTALLAAAAAARGVPPDTPAVVRG